ncbi:MAG: hypothetical protein CVU48_07910 [Candidatus Cloacimonetes bacterium HGW-Cloacimonetes-1]|jgi:hypothetical protein|nr:MAG: hypothetical protein CVU48_07910 [Candidatus Cloacimonetes bacterium HGW-Cloacimonetes-1]
MGFQQIVLIILGVILVGIAVSIGMVVFHNHAMMAHRQALIAEMNQIMLDATTFSKTSLITGGGGGSYWGYLPTGAVPFSDHIENPDNTGCKLETPEVNYFVECWAVGSYPQRVTITASSKLYGDGNYLDNASNARIVASFDSNGKIIVNSSGKSIEFSGSWEK